MFEDLFRKSSTPADPDREKGKPPLADGTPPATDAQSAPGLSAAETQAWRDRILAAGPDDAALLQLAREAPSIELKLAALQALTQEDSFREAMDEYRDRDKRLYRTVRSRWDAARARRAASAEADALIAAARGLLDQELVPANRVAELDRAWATVSDAGLPPELRPNLRRCASSSAPGCARAARVRRH